MTTAGQQIAANANSNVNQNVFGSILYNVKAYGAKGDGVADDATAFNSAASALKSAGGGVLLVPPGKYVLSSPITITDTDIVIKGSGAQLSLLFFTGSDGIVYTTTNLYSDAIQIEDISVISTSANLYKGISISLPSNTGSPWRNALIENVVVAGSSTVAAYNDGTNNSQIAAQKWATAVYLNNCAVSVIRDSVIRTGGGNTGDGIWLDGYTVDILIQGVKVYYANIAIKKTGLGEGLIVDNCMLINVNYGVYANQGAVSQQGVYGAVQNSHINYTTAGIIFVWQPQVSILNNLIYKQGTQTGASDILLTNCDRSKVIGNTCIVNVGGGSANGIVIDSNDCFLQDNMVQERGTGIWIKTTKTTNQIVGNKLSGNTTNVLDQGTGTYYGKRSWAFSQVLTPTGTLFNADLVIPSGYFTAKPSAAFMTSQAQDITGFYEYDSPSSTATNARFHLVKRDGTAFSGAAERFSVVLHE